MDISGALATSREWQSTVQLRLCRRAFVSYYALESAVQASILNRFGNVRGLNFFRGGEIGDRPADFENPTTVRAA
jgi:hypothetical protein